MLVFTSSYPRWFGDSSGSFVAELCRRLASSHSVNVVAPGHSAASRFERRDNVGIYRFSYWFPATQMQLCYGGGILANLQRRMLARFQVPFFAVAAFLRIFSVVARQRPDVISAHWIVPGGAVAALAAKILNIPLVLTAHGSDIKVLESLPSFLIKEICEASVGITVNSEWSQMTLANLLTDSDRRLIFRVPMGIGDQFFEPRGNPAFSSSLRVLFVGRLTAEKNVESVLNAIAACLRAGILVTATIVGEGPRRSELQALVTDLHLTSVVRFLGSVPAPEMPSVYRNHDVLVIASVYEGQSLVSLEALACGLPVISSRVGIVTELVTHQVNGILLETSSSSNLAAAISAVAENPAMLARLKAGATGTNMERFRWDLVARTFEMVLHRAFEG